MKTETRSSHPRPQEAQLAIFWLLGDRLILDSVPLSRGERYGSFLAHPASHADYWVRAQRAGTVPRDAEYDEPPRGRVSYDARDERFILLADRCILLQKTTLRQLYRRLGLPSDTRQMRDEHYRCAKCLVK